MGYNGSTLNKTGNNIMPYTFEQTDGGCGTCLQGYLTLERSKLVSIFGEPEVYGDPDDKVYCEWCIEITDENGESGVVTIYDWKNYSDAAMADDYKEWNVGGMTDKAARVLNECISEQLNPNGNYGNYVRTSYF